MTPFWTDKTNSLMKLCTVGAQHISCLKASLKVSCTFVNMHTNMNKLMFLLQESACIEAERRSSVPPNHNASFHLSVSLGTCLNKRWLTFSYTHTISPTESSESLSRGCFEVTQHKDTSCSKLSKLLDIHHSLLLNGARFEKILKQTDLEKSSQNWDKMTIPSFDFP